MAARLARVTAADMPWLDVDLTPPDGGPETIGPAVYTPPARAKRIFPRDSWSLLVRAAKWRCMLIISGGESGVSEPFPDEAPRPLLLTSDRHPAFIVCVICVICG